MSKFLRRSLLIFIIKVFRTIVFIFIVISTTFRPICPPAFFRCLSNSGTFTELRTTSFIETTRVACSDSICHDRVQVLSIPVYYSPVVRIEPTHITVTPCIQQDTWRNGYSRWFPELLRRQSSEGCRFNPHYRRVIYRNT